MPIKPENKKLYPKNWKEIRQQILKRADNKCEFCGVPNHIKGIRTFDGGFLKQDATTYNFIRTYYPQAKIIQIVLTIAHLDHNPQNNNPDNLRALCQKCHNNYDKEHRKQTRVKSLAQKKGYRNEN